MKLLQLIRNHSSQNNLSRVSINIRWSSTLPNSHVRAESEEIQEVRRKPIMKPFVKNMFLGKYDTEILSFPEVLETDQLEELENKAALFEKLLSNKDASNSFKRRWEEMKKVCLFGLQVPSEYGGLGFNATEYTRICEVISQHVPLATALTAHQSYGMRGLLTVGTKKQKEEYLPRLASGEWISAFCFAEPSNSLVDSNVGTMAKQSHGSDKWYINGSKILVSGDGNADLITVIAKTETKEFGGKKSDVLTAFLVDRTLGGMSFDKTEDIADKSVQVCEVRFNNTPVPPKNILGDIGDGYKLCADILGSNRFSTGSFSAGILKRLLAKVTNHVVDQKQLGKPLVCSEIIQEKIAKIVCSIYTLESLSYLTAGLLDKYENPDVSVEAAIVKVLSSQMLCDGILECQNILGGVEFLKNSSCDTIFRDSRLHMLLEGSNEVLRSFIALSGLQHAGNALKKDVEKVRNPLMHPTYVLQRMLQRRNHTKDNPKLVLGLDGYAHPSLQTASQQLEHGVLKLQFVTEILLSRYGRSIIEREMELNRLTDIVGGLFAMTAVIARASRSYCTGIQDSEYEVATAQTICNIIFEMLKQKVKEIQDGPILSLDGNYTKIADKVYRHKQYFLEHPLVRNIA